MLVKQGGRFLLSLFIAVAALSSFSSLSSAATDNPFEKHMVMAEALSQAEPESSASREPAAETGKKPAEEFLSRLDTEVVVKKEEGITQDAESYVRYMPARAAHGQSGKVGLTASNAEYNYSWKAFGKLPVEFSIDSEYISINNSTVVKLPAHLTSLSVGAEVTMPFFNFDKTYFRVGVYPSMETGNWNFRSSAFRIPSQYTLIYQPNEKLTLVAGVGVFPDYLDPVWGAAGFIYKPDEKWTFNIIPERPTITYAFSDKLSVFTEAALVRGEFEVDKDGRKGVILEYDENRLGAGIQYQPNKNIQTSLSVGGAFGRNFRYDDSLGKVNIKNGFYTEFRVQIVI